MAVASAMAELGREAPDFALPDGAGRIWRLADFAPAPALIVAFLCNHCPYVLHIIGGFVALAAEQAAHGVACVAISANDPIAYPADAPERMVEFARTHRFGFPYLFDATQEVAQAYDAVCTPDFYVFDRARRLAYRGRMDGASPGNGVAVSGEALAAALARVLDGAMPDLPQRPSLGCSIKWRTPPERPPG